MRSQRTISHDVTVSGIGLFGSADVKLTFRPAPENHGIAFCRVDVDSTVKIPALIEYVQPQNRRTVLARQGVTVETVEHVMAALSGLQIDNCLVELDAPEPPVGDGSSQVFVEALLETDFVEHSAPRPCLTVTNKVHIFEMDHSAEILARPARDGAFCITYELDYGHPHIPAQSVTSVVTPDLFADTIAFARTFVLEEEVEGLRAQGFGRRITPRNLLVFGPDGPIENQVHVEDECARHKLLDCIGDLALLGCDFVGSLTATRTGHRHNLEVARDLLMTHPHILDEIRQSHAAVLNPDQQGAAA